MEKITQRRNNSNSWTMYLKYIRTWEIINYDIVMFFLNYSLIKSKMLILYIIEYFILFFLLILLIIKIYKII